MSDCPLPHHWLDPWLAPRRALIVSTLASGAVVGVCLGFSGIAALGWRITSRGTAELAFGLWLLTFSAAALAKLFPSPGTRAMRRGRRGLGLAYATAQGIHGAAVLRLATLDAQVLQIEPATIVGSLGFVWIFAMAMTSNDRAVRLLGPTRWRRLHLGGQFMLLTFYLFAYGGRIAEDLSDGEPGWPAFWPAMALILIALGLRLAARLQSDRLRKIKLPTE